MARIRNRRSTQPVTPRTMARRARKRAAAEETRALQKKQGSQPETIGQARVWTRKAHRYDIAGLCPTCAAQAAWGHAVGFQKIKDPCAQCQPLVTAFPHPGPRGSKWRKILDKLEYMDEETLSAWLDAHDPEG